MDPYTPQNPTTPQGNAPASPSDAFPYSGAPGPGYGMPPVMGEVSGETNPNNPEEERKAKMRQRLFWLFFVLSLILLALIVWEVVDCFAGY